MRPMPDERHHMFVSEGPAKLCMPALQMHACQHSCSRDMRLLLGGNACLAQPCCFLGHSRQHRLEKGALHGMQAQAPWHLNTHMQV